MRGGRDYWKNPRAGDDTTLHKRIDIPASCVRVRPFVHHVSLCNHMSVLKIWIWDKEIEVIYARSDRSRMPRQATLAEQYHYFNAHFTEPCPLANSHPVVRRQKGGDECTCSPHLQWVCSLAISSDPITSCAVKNCTG